MPQINSIMYNLIDYVRSGAVIRIGENTTLQPNEEFGATRLTAIPITEYREYIMSDEEDDVLLVTIVA